MAMWFAACISPSPISGTSPHVIPPQPPHPPHCHSLGPSNRPQYVILPSLCPCVLIIQHLPMSENMWCLVFCSSVSLLRIMVSRFIHVSTKEVLFYDCLVFYGVYVPHFPCPVYRRWAFGLFPGLCYCKLCCNEHLCACVFIVERFIILFSLFSFYGISGSRSLRNCYTVFTMVDV